MKIPRPIKYKFVFDLLQKRSLYPFYDAVRNTSNDEYFYDQEDSPSVGLYSNIHVVNFIPPFLDPRLSRHKSKKGLTAINFQQFSGFMVDLESFEDVDTYIRSKMGSRGRKIRGYIRKLESCFKVEYAFYHGEITRNRYDLLLKKMHAFLTNRFEQKGGAHELVKQWDFISETTYGMILNKTASIFVIYANDQPIDICLSYHYQNIYHNAIGAYDTDYSKFSLGHIDLYKQLQWCFNNNIRLFDLSVGDMEYKRKWCNVIYNFEHQILYDQTSYLNKTIAYSLVRFYKVKEFLKRKNVHLFYHRLKKIMGKSREPKKGQIENYIEISELEVVPSNENLTLLDVNLSTNAFLRKPLYDFLYTNKDTLENTKVFSLNDRPNSYIIHGTHKIQQLYSLPSNTDPLKMEK